MITELTPEQEKLIVKWREDGLRRGLQPAPVNPSEMTPIINNLCTVLLQWEKAPKEVILEPSPLAAWRRVNKIVNPDEKLAFQWPYLDGHYSSFYFAWVRCWKEIGVTGFPDTFDVYAETEKLGPIYPLSDLNVVVVSDTVRDAKLGDGRLHCETGPAVHYADNFDVWALHGVRVPKIVVTTKPEEVDKDWLQKHFLAQQNVEIRKEVLIKVGLDRLMGLLGGKILDKDGTYELITIDIGGGIEHPFLRMINPSTDTTHVESVDRSCRTVQEALLFRSNLKPEQIDDKNGAEWFQQGDVLMFPEGASKFKSRPSVLR